MFIGTSVKERNTFVCVHDPKDEKLVCVTPEDYLLIVEKVQKDKVTKLVEKL
jgi:hypothetical protein